MAYARYRLRGKLLGALEKIPENLTPRNIGLMTSIIAEVRALHQELAKEPFEYVNEATRKEHKDLSDLFVKLLALVSWIMQDALAAFRAGRLEFNVDSRITEIRDRLSTQAEGQSATSMLLAKVFHEGRSDTETS